MCPGGASGGMPVAVISVYPVATLLLVGTFYVATTMSQPERCFGCKEGGGGLACSNASTEVVKVRAVVSILTFASWLLLAVLSGLVLHLPEISPEGWSGMVAVAVLASLLTAASLCIFPNVFQKWVKQPFCCLCQQKVNLDHVVPSDLESSVSCCQHCKFRVEGTHRAPAGVIEYEASVIKSLIVRIPYRIEAIKHNFREGLPVSETRFKATNLPTGLSVEPLTGAIVGTPTLPVTNSEINVTAYNRTGECSSKIILAVLDQRVPSGLSYDDSVRHSSEGGTDGLYLIGKHVSITPKIVGIGIPAGKFTVYPPLPAGLKLDEKNGHIVGTLSKVTTRMDYIVTLANSAGKDECSISLEVS